MKRNELRTRPAPEDKQPTRPRQAYRKPMLKRLGVLESVAGSNLKWGPRRY